MRLRARSVVMAALAFALVALLPLAARATIIPVCADDELATVVPAAPEPSCEVVTSIDDVTGETSVAPICDARGASAIAPPRILPIVDARIEAVPSCGSDGSSPALLLPHRGENPGPPPSFGADPAAMSTVLAVMDPRAFDEAPGFLVDPGAPRAGVRRDVYHPPR